MRHVQVAGQLWASRADVKRLCATAMHIVCGVNGLAVLQSVFYAMSVVRRNTFDLFDEEADLLFSSEAKTPQKKKRRKKRTSIESSVIHGSQKAVVSHPAADNEKHEVGPEGALPVMRPGLTESVIIKHTREPPLPM